MKLFLKGTRRLWLLALWIHVGVFAWYSVHHQDRYLQGLLPLMAGWAGDALGARQVPSTDVGPHHGDESRAKAKD